MVVVVAAALHGVDVVEAAVTSVAVDVMQMMMVMQILRKR